MNPVTEIDAPRTGPGALLDEFVDGPAVERTAPDAEVNHGR